MWLVATVLNNAGLKSVGILIFWAFKMSSPEDSKRLNIPCTLNHGNKQLLHTMTREKTKIILNKKKFQANRSDTRLWSDPTVVKARTLSKVPDLCPDTNLGSFEVVANGLQERTVYVYWKQIPRTSQNGPDFRYRITEVFEDGVPRWVCLIFVLTKVWTLHCGKSICFNIWNIFVLVLCPLHLGPNIEVIANSRMIKLTNIFVFGSGTNRVSSNIWSPKAADTIICYPIKRCALYFKFKEQELSVAIGFIPFPMKKCRKI